MISYQNIKTKLQKPYTFAIGESLQDGLMYQDIRKVPHLLVSGSTGGGKSAFTRQLLMGLLESTKTGLQMYLIDLKRGVEFREFSKLPNVTLAKNEEEAVELLEALKDEMYKRFNYLEENGYNSINPKRDKKDIIVIAIDEASVLYGKSRQKDKANLVEKARELTDELAKLARSSGIHLVISTQKAIKDSLDTKTTENLTGRMAFKMSTHAGSVSALGNNKAYSLPDIQGRGIWAGGNKFIEIQAPYLSEDELKDECELMKNKMKEDSFKNYQEMIINIGSKKNVQPKMSTDTSTQILVNQDAKKDSSTYQ